MHLLKWRYQPGLRSTSWRSAIDEQRLRLDVHLIDNPSLNAGLDQAIQQGYRLARLEAERETGLPRDTFPLTCPFSFAQVMQADFWPE
jgi:hypothetical protein